MRIGIGIDFHRLAEKRTLVIGGVVIPYAKGLAGHSDADVLMHAICDALLGAAGLGDIGEKFPNTDPKYKDISSLKLLEKVAADINSLGYRAANIDSILLCEEPKLSSYKEKMRENIAGILKIDKALVNIKATTTEKMGSIGRGEGIAAQAVALLEKNK